MDQSVGDPLLDISAYAPSVAAMSEALAAGDERAFRTALLDFNAVRDGEVLTGVRKVTAELQNALKRFEIDSRLIDLAQHQVPAARRRLGHVIELTADAANQTLDLVEQCLPSAEQLLEAAEALQAAPGREGAPAREPLGEFLQQVVDGMRSMRARLLDVQLAQGFQDLSGQIIRSVMELVEQLERALAELARIAGGADDRLAKDLTVRRVHGPVVPGVEHGDAVSGQQDVDTLLAGLGM